MVAVIDEKVVAAVVLPPFDHKYVTDEGPDATVALAVSVSEPPVHTIPVAGLEGVILGMLGASSTVTV